MPLNGSQLDRVHQTILAVYTRDELWRAVRICMDLSPNDYAPDKGFTDQLWALIEWANRHDLLYALIHCSYENNSTSIPLKNLWAEAQEWNWTRSLSSDVGDPSMRANLHSSNSVSDGEPVTAKRMDRVQALAVPRYQKWFEYSLYILAGILGLGALMDAIDNAVSFVTLPVTVAGTVGILLIWISIQLWLKQRPLRWTDSSGKVVLINKLDNKYSCFLVGYIVLLWIPVLVNWGLPNENADSVIPTLVPTTTTGDSLSISGNVSDSTIIQSGGGNVIISAAVERTLSPFLDALRKGSRLLDEGDLDAAEEQFVEASNLDSASPVPDFWIAKVALQRRHPENALEYLDYALSLDPKHEPSLVLRIMIMLEQGQTGEAEKVAAQSYGVSGELDSWLQCLDKQRFFDEGITTRSGINSKCVPPSYK